MASEPISGVVTRYRTRFIRFLRLHREHTFALKVYGITREPRAVKQALVDSALEMAMSHLRTPTTSPSVAGIDWWSKPSHGVGSLIVHEGSDAAFALLDVWVDDNMLRHHVWTTPVDEPVRFKSLRETDLAMCVWELAVIQHERAAWLRHVYREDGASELKAYLADVLNADV